MVNNDPDLSDFDKYLNFININLIIRNDLGGYSI